MCILFFHTPFYTFITNGMILLCLQKKPYLSPQKSASPPRHTSLWLCPKDWW